MAFRCSKKNVTVIVTATMSLLLLRFLLLDMEYMSSYANTITPYGGLILSIKPRISAAAAGEQKIYQEFQQQDPCSGRYIYMHDLPSRFNHELVMKCETLRKKFNLCPYVENGGFGSRFSFNDSSDGPESVISGESWYITYQFMLEMIFHSRMKQYECLTSNSSLASAIYAPFYPGLEAGRYLWGNFSSSEKDAGAYNFTSWLKRRPEWARMFGWDHFFVAGRISLDFRRSIGGNWSNKLMNLPEVKNMTMPDNACGSNWGSKLINWPKTRTMTMPDNVIGSERDSNLMNLPETKNMTMLTVESNPHANNDFAVPYPSYFHPSKDSEVLQWQERVRRAKRAHLFAFAGATRPYNYTIRGELIDQCKQASSNNRCKLVSCAPNDEVNCNSPDHFIKAFMMTDFCLQPPGDSDTRRSTFDAILSGCIPVFFHPGSAYTQYFWHFPKNYTSYSVFIPMKGINNGTE